MKRRTLPVGDAALLAFTVLCLWALLPWGGPNLANLELYWPGSDLCPPPQQVPAHAGGALLVCRLPTAEAPPPLPYRREAFGPPWYDQDGNGCDTRNDVLRRDLIGVRFRSGGASGGGPATSGAGSCKVAFGVLDDPYTGQRITLRAGRNSSEIQIDHVVALGDAWRSGAWQWTDRQRRAYANDPAVLLAVQGRANQDKGAQNAAQWLPVNRSFHCAYAVRQVAIKYEWNLGVTGAERRRLAQILRRC